MKSITQHIGKALSYGERYYYLVSSILTTDFDKLDKKYNSIFSYSFFHLTLALATMFMTTQLTRWFHPKEFGEIVQRQEILSDRSWSTVGVKIVCGWICGLIYLVYLLMPDRKGKLIENISILI